MVKPFLKWAGGKTSSSDIIIKNLPDKCPNWYYEPFFGGGAIFFALYNAKRVNNAVLSDTNNELIITCNAIKNDVEGVISAISDLKPEIIDLDKYNHIRAANPSSSIECAARMIFLNKVGFNGLYRVNKSGKFNVPYSKRAFWNPDFENLREVSVAFRNAEIVNENYTIARKANSGDVVYFDPPYLPLSKTSNFVSYTKDGFTLEDQIELGRFFEELSEKGVFVALSNSDHPEIHKIYSKIHGIKIEKLLVKRRINSDATKRHSINELLITNNYGK